MMQHCWLCSVYSTLFIKSRMLSRSKHIAGDVALCFPRIVTMWWHSGCARTLLTTQWFLLPAGGAFIAGDALMYAGTFMCWMKHLARQVCSQQKTLQPARMGLPGHWCVAFTAA
jgi:hypothetical protein